MYNGRQKTIHKGKRDGYYIMVNNKRVYLKNKLKENNKSISIQKNKLKLFGGTRPTNKKYNDLTANEQDSVKKLGFRKETWNYPMVLQEKETLLFNELPQEKKNAAQLLGYKENEEVPISFRKYFWFWSETPKRNDTWVSMNELGQNALCNAAEKFENITVKFPSPSGKNEDVTFEFVDPYHRIRIFETEVIYIGGRFSRYALKGVKTTYKVIKDTLQPGEDYKRLIHPKSLTGILSRLELPHNVRVNKRFRTASGNTCCICNTDVWQWTSFHCSYCGIWTCREHSGIFTKVPEFRNITNGGKNGEERGESNICASTSKIGDHPYNQLCYQLLTARAPNTRAPNTRAVGAPASTAIVCFPKPMIRFTKGECISSGSFGKVYKVNGKDNLVVKILDLNQIKKQDEYEDIKGELKTLVMFKDVEHPNLVKFDQVYIENRELGILQEQLSSDLYNVMKIIKLNDLQNRCILNQVAQGLYFFHTVSIVWRDLKPENIMLNFLKGGSIIPIKNLTTNRSNFLNADIKLQVKLIDFGFCFANKNTTLQNNTPNTKVCGTPYYVSPEILQQNPYRREVDIWAFGCLCFEMYHTSPLFSNYSVTSVFNKIKRYQPRGHINTHINSVLEDEDLKDLIKNCLNPDVKERFTINNVLEHKFFTENEESFMAFLPVDYRDNIISALVKISDDTRIKALRAKFDSAEQDLQEIFSALVFRGGKSHSKKKTYTKIISNRKRVIHTGSRGGKYYIRNKRKVYI